MGHFTFKNKMINRLFVTAKHIGQAFTTKMCHLLKLSIVRIHPFNASHPKQITLKGALIFQILATGSSFLYYRKWSKRMKKLRIFVLVGCPKPAVLFTFRRVNIFQKIHQTDELSLLMLQQIPSRLYSAKHFRVNISKIFPVVCPSKLISEESNICEACINNELNQVFHGCDEHKKL